MSWCTWNNRRWRNSPPKSSDCGISKMAERFRLNCPEIELMGHICLDLFFRIILRIVPRKLTIFHYDEKVSFHPISANPNLKNKSGGHHRFLASPESHDGWKMIFFPFGTAYFQGLCYVNFMGVLQKNTWHSPSWFTWILYKDQAFACHWKI